jgi:hypothetical protein
MPGKFTPKGGSCQIHLTTTKVAEPVRYLLACDEESPLWGDFPLIHYAARSASLASKDGKAAIYRHTHTI